MQAKSKTVKTLAFQTSAENTANFPPRRKKMSVKTSEIPPPVAVNKQLEDEKHHDKKDKKSPEEYQEEISRKLLDLQVTARVITENYLQNLQKLLSKITVILAEKHASEHDDPLTRRKLKDMLEELDELVLKPEKGRPKDLRRIQRIVEEIDFACEKSE